MIRCPCCTIGRLVSFFFQAEDGIRDGRVTGVQTCALPIWLLAIQLVELRLVREQVELRGPARHVQKDASLGLDRQRHGLWTLPFRGEGPALQIGRASCRERGTLSVRAVILKKNITDTRADI